MFWAGDENCQWTTMYHADCLWESSRSSDQLQRRRGGRTWTCSSVERRLDDVWRTVVDYERRHSRPVCRSRTGTMELSDAGNETSRCRAWTWPAAARWANDRCGECQSVRGQSYFRVSVTTRTAVLSTRCSLSVVAFGDSASTALQ